VIQSGRAAVATPAPEATRAAVAALRAGGNAVDAAVAAAWVLSVCEPATAGIGGTTVMLVRPARGDATVVDAGCRSPDAATGRQPAPGGSAGPAPATPAVLELSRWLLGRLSAEAALAPAIAAAENGVRLTPRRWRELSGLRGPAALGLLPDGRLPAAGTLLPQPRLARCLWRMATAGVDDFYHDQPAVTPVMTPPRPARYRGHVVLTADALGGVGLRRALVRAEGLGPTRTRAAGALARPRGAGAQVSVIDAEGTVAVLSMTLGSRRGAGTAHPEHGFLHDDLARRATPPRAPAAILASPDATLPLNLAGLAANAGSEGLDALVGAIARLVDGGFVDSHDAGDALGDAAPNLTVPPVRRLESVLGTMAVGRHRYAVTGGPGEGVAAVPAVPRAHVLVA
jgi:Gamma-glutamyltranspeptidase